LLLIVAVTKIRKLKISVHTKLIKFFKAFNALFSKIGGKASDTIILHLARSFCLPILLYGLEAVPLSQTILNSLSQCWARVMYEIFGVSSYENVYCISLCTGILPLQATVHLYVFVLFVCLFVFLCCHDS